MERREGIRGAIQRFTPPHSLHALIIHPMVAKEEGPRRKVRGRRRGGGWRRKKKKAPSKYQGPCRHPEKENLKPLLFTLQFRSQIHLIWK